MLRRPPINLNVQSQNATITLIREALAAGLEVTEVIPLFRLPLWRLGHASSLRFMLMPLALRRSTSNTSQHSSQEFL
jgi:hypothetical protein